MRISLIIKVTIRVHVYKKSTATMVVLACFKSGYECCTSGLFSTYFAQQLWLS